MIEPGDAPNLAPVGTPGNVKAEPHPEGVRVSWTATAPSFRVTRDPAAEATVDKPEFIDRRVELEKEYKYRSWHFGNRGKSAGRSRLRSYPGSFCPGTHRRECHRRSEFSGANVGSEHGGGSEELPCVPR